MWKDNKTTVIANIAKNTFLRNIFFISLIIFIIFPLYWIFAVMPSFTNQLSANIEEDAFRTGRHLNSMLFNITTQKQKLDNLLFRSLIVAIATSLILLSSVVLMLLKVSKTDIKHKKAENDLKHANKKLEERVEEQAHEIKATQKISIEALAILSEYYDLETGAHLDRIQRYVSLLVTYLRDHSLYSKYLQPKPNYVEEVALASVLHDIGKTVIPKEILAKPGKLTEEEFKLMQRHTEIAGEILDRANRNFMEKFNKDSYLALARDIALSHHEKWNGKGYPYGLKDESIPLSARIVALADVYDALRSKRPYKEPWSHKNTADEIVKEKEHHFDPNVVDAFLANFELFKAISSRN